MSTQQNAAGSMVNLAALQPGLAPPTLGPTGSMTSAGGTMLPPLTTATSLSHGGSMQLRSPTVPETPTQDHVFSILSNDSSFVAAVRKQDVTQAAVTASALIKQHLHVLVAKLKKEQQQALPALLTAGGPPQALPAGPGLGKRVSIEPPGLGKRPSEGVAYMAPLDSAGRHRELKPGDWVSIKSSNKSTDPELVGQEGSVLKVDHNGWIEVHVPKLGRYVRLQQRYLTPIPQPVAAGPAGTMRFPRAASLTSPAGPMGMPGMNDLPGLPNTGGGRMGAMRPSDPGGLPSMMLDAGGMVAGRASKRQRSDECHIRPALPPEVILPPRIAAPIGRAVSKLKEVVKAVRREMLVLEEAVPWEYVVDEWRNQRKPWRNTVRNMEQTTKQAEALVCVCAGAMAELHEALKSPKSEGLFAKHGAWESRLYELAQGGNNYMCLQQLWEEMREGIRLMLEGPAGTAAIAASAQHLMMIAAHQQQHQQAQALPQQHALHLAQGPPSSKASHMAACRAFAAMDAAAARGEAYIGQVPLDKILASSREGFSALRSLVEREKQHLAMRMDLVARGEPLSEEEMALLQAYTHGGGGAMGAEGAAAGPASAALHTPFGDYAGAGGKGAAAAGMGMPASLAGMLLMTSYLRSDLALIHNVDSEVDTDNDDGGEATDMEDSD